MSEKEGFEFGELVEVRNTDTKEWDKRHYVMTKPKGEKRFVTIAPVYARQFFDDEVGTYVSHFAQIRKIQKPDTTKQRIDSFEAKLNAILERYNKAMESMIKKLEEDND